MRDVAGSLAINPNTVLKAYRELELEGLVEGRPGRDVRAALPRRALAASQAGLRRELVAWLRRARKAGLDRDDVVALIETTMRDFASEGAA